jgi:predicted permease
MLTRLDQFARDLRLGTRNLCKSPGFTTLAIACLALGIAATTVIYSALYAVVLDPFPYKDVDNLMSVRVQDPNGHGRLSYSVDQFLEIARRNTIFEGTIASTISDVLWTGDGDPQRLRGNHGTFNTFQVMGVAPLLGRTPAPDDARADAPPVAVLGYRFWQRQFGGDPGVIGRQLRLNDQPRTVIGIMPKRFMWRGADVYLPVVFQPGRAVEGVHFVHLLGRLRRGITGAEAEANLAPIIADLKTKEPDQFPDKWRVGLLSFKETFPSDIREDLWILFGAVGLLLVISCANVSNLLLSKATTRQHEMAVRAALGASRLRLLQQLLTESLLLALAAGVIGTALAYGGLKGILALVPRDTIPDESEIALNTSVLAFTIVVSALTSVVCGLAPALHACRRDLANPLRETSRMLIGSMRQALLRNGLVIAEVSLSLMLLVGAALMIRAYLAVQSVDPRLPVDRLLTLRIPFASQRYPTPERRIAFLEELLRRVSTVPGVAAVGLNTDLHPFGNAAWAVEVEGSGRTSGQPVIVHQINPDYTRVFGIALVGGRPFDERETHSRRRLALVNQTFARARLDGQDPMGRIIHVPRLRQPPFGLADDSFQIVGVVKDTMNRTPRSEVSPEVYLPFTVLGVADHLVTLTEPTPSAVARAVIGQVYAIDKDQPVTSVQTIDTILREDVYAGPRFNLALFTVFAVLGLALAIIGVYGVMANAVAQQTHEIGIRMALGADARSIACMVVRRGSRLMLAGVAIGLAGSLATARVLAREIWNVSPFDPVSFAAVSVILLAAGLQACIWPARRAARVDPVTALRAE